jgi:hypothetical protein
MVRGAIGGVVVIMAVPNRWTGEARQPAEASSPRETLGRTGGFSRTGEARQPAEASSPAVPVSTITFAPLPRNHQT